MKILAIGAHPDDIELFMYGILSIYKKRGEELSLLVATDGSKGGENTKKNLIETRRKETVLGLEKIGMPTLLHLPDGSLGNDIEHKKKIESQINKFLPDLIITHSKNDYHSDHIELSKIIKEIVSHYIPILYCDTMLGINFNPNYYIDITDHFSNKKRAITCHKSQNPKKLVKLAILMNSFRAAQCNAPEGKYVEAYKFKKSFPFADIRHLLPKPPKIQKFYVNKLGGFL